MKKKRTKKPIDGVKPIKLFQEVKGKLDEMKKPVEPPPPTLEEYIRLDPLYESVMSVPVKVKAVPKLIHLVLDGKIVCTVVVSEAPPQSVPKFGDVKLTWGKQGTVQPAKPWWCRMFGRSR